MPLCAVSRGNDSGRSFIWGQLLGCESLAAQWAANDLGKPKLNTCTAGPRVNLTTRTVRPHPPEEEPMTDPHDDAAPALRDVKSRIREGIEQEGDALLGLSRRIH